MTTPRILITGFSAFPGARRNPSEVLVRGLDIATLSRRLGIGLATAILPTEYEAVSEMLPRLWKDLEPDAVIHFGLAGRAGRVRLEAFGRNASAPFRPDAAGRLPTGRVIEPGGPIQRRATLPLARLAAALTRQSIPAAISVDAGGYLCNFATYVSLGIAAQTAEPKPLAGFVHLPWPAEERVPARRPAAPVGGNWHRPSRRRSRSPRCWCGAGDCRVKPGNDVEAMDAGETDLRRNAREAKHRRRGHLRRAHRWC